jgi:Peptidase inhibitor family I36
MNSAFKTVILAAAAAFMAFSGAAQAAQPAVCVYEHANFKGWRLCFNYGQDVGYIGNSANDKVSSIWMQRGVVLTICEHANYAGGCRTLYQNEPYVGDGWNDIISSLSVDQ